jgi:hypothetical protein
VDATLALTTGPLTALKRKFDRANLDVVVHNGYLAATFRGYGKAGAEMFTRLGMEKPAKKGKAA